jgi:membrane protease YdiL (CAAX protease family)
VLLHGITEYLFWKQTSSSERINLELNFNSAKLSNVENEPIQDYNQPLYQQLANLSPESTKFSPNNPPWTGLAAFLMWIASVVLIMVVPTIGVGIYLLVRQVPVTDAQQLTEFVTNDATAIFVNILMVFPAHLLTILLAWLIVTQVRKHSFTEMLGWQMGGFKFLHLVGIVVGFFVLAGVVGYFIPEQENDLIRILKSSRATVFAVALMATFTAPLVEEVVYRGVLYSAFQESFGVAPAVILVTFLFSFVHIPQYYPSFSTIFLICLLSLVLTLVRVKSDNLLPCIILHTIFNGVQSSLLIAEPYLRQFAPENPQPAFFFLN